MTTVKHSLDPRAQAGRVDDSTDPDPEVTERARGPLRRSAKYKARIFEEYEALNKEGKGALLRREGLYSSLILGVAKTTRPGCARGAYAQRRLARSSQ